MDYLIDQITFLPDSWKPRLKSGSMDILAWSDWFCGVRNPLDIFDENPSLIIYEYLFYFFGFLTFVHAWRTGNRYWYTWIAIILHGLNTECLSYFIPDFDSFWHAQASLMFAGRRLPAQIIVTYAIFDYTAYVAAKRLKLPWWAESCAVGLGAVLIDVPYDIMGIKNLWWTWHDTDPNIADRMYHVPWTSYYFHASFACSLTIILHWTRRWFLPAEYDWKLFPREFLCCLIAGVGSFWLGAVQFIPLYHVLHDIFLIHTEICTLTFLAIYALIVWTADRKTKREKPKPFHWFDALFLLLVLYYAFFMTLVLVAQPESIQSTGLHETIGNNCKETIPVQTLSGIKLSKQKYLCARKYDEPYYDFHCDKARGIPPKPSRDKRPVEWYTVCGTPFPNHAEYIAVIYATCIFALYIFYQWMINSGDTPMPPIKKQKRKQQ